MGFEVESEPTGAARHRPSVFFEGCPGTALKLHRPHDPRGRVSTCPRFLRAAALPPAEVDACPILHCLSRFGARVRETRPGPGERQGSVGALAGAEARRARGPAAGPEHTPPRRTRSGATTRRRCAMRDRSEAAIAYARRVLAASQGDTAVEKTIWGSPEGKKACRSGSRRCSRRTRPTSSRSPAALRCCSRGSPPRSRINDADPENADASSC
jgi:hypothetical protein